MKLYSEEGKLDAGVEALVRFVISQWATSREKALSNHEELINGFLNEDIKLWYSMKFTAPSDNMVEEEETEEDLLDTPELIPLEVQLILQKYQNGDFDYIVCAQLQQELEYVGYTIEWGLDAEPYGLRKK
jgi:hypothetical protein